MPQSARTGEYRHPAASTPKTVEFVLEKEYVNEHACANQRRCMPPEECRCVVLLSADAPHRVVSIDSCFEHLFGFKIDGMRRLLCVITGPKTDAKSLNKILSATSMGQSCTCALIFYAKNGDEVHCTVRSKYTLFEGSFVICLNLETSAIRTTAENLALEQLLKTEQFENIQNATTHSQCVSSHATIDTSVLIHMKAVKRAAYAAKLNKT